METPNIFQIISALISSLALLLSFLAYMNKKTKDEKQELQDLKKSASDDHVKLEVLINKVENDKTLLNKIDAKLDKISEEL
jgi:hypothetical protein